MRGCFLIFLVGSLAHATLGQGTPTIENDRAALKAAAQPHRAPASLYQTRELKAGGSIVTEYLSREGTVFAISWRGVTNPSLEPLLGSYYREYLAGNAALPRKIHVRRDVTIRTANLVLHRSHRSGNLQGLVYVPKLLPAHINAEKLPL